MVFKYICFFVIWMKVALAFEGLERSMYYSIQIKIIIIFSAIIRRNHDRPVVSGGRNLSTIILRA